MATGDSNVVGRGADDRLSRCASALLGLAEREHLAYEDLDLFYAPSECARDVRRQTERDAERILREHRYTSAEFATQMENRTCGRFTHCEAGAAIMSVLPEPDEDVAES